MKTIKITYYTLTVIIAVMMTYSAFNYLTNEQMKQAFIHMGFPAFFRVELAVAKFIGAAMLLLPVTAKVKEWTYAGFAIVFVSAITAHASLGHPAATSVVPAVFLALLAGSYVSYHKLQSIAYGRRSQTGAETNPVLSKSVAA